MAMGDCSTSAERQEHKSGSLHLTNPEIHPYACWRYKTCLGARLNKFGGRMFLATGDFIRNYRDMREANTIGGDKYFHCKANCEASKRGAYGKWTAEKLSNGREWFDQNI
ncbi:MAG: hypothetical protein FWH56_09010, partial [Betaproteobacteria bacterium]|nr:hypothetical protein [Betaproteobacteria bacterium]